MPTKTKLSAYTNKKTAYEKDKAEYESANILKRQLMREAVARVRRSARSTRS